MGTTPAAPVSAPAAAPAASPAVTPTPSPTPSPAPAAAPAAPAAPAVPLTLGEKIAQGWEKAKAAVPLDGSEPPKVEDPKPAEGDQPATAEGDQPAAEGDQPEGDQPPAGGAEEDFKLNLDDSAEATGPDKFAAELAKSPEAKAWLDANPELKNAVFGALRRDSENREIRQYFPTAEDAKQGAGWSAAYQTFDNKFLAADSPEGAQQFLDHWVREALITDDNGQPLIENGQYVVHPSLGIILDQIGNNKAQVWAKEIEAGGKVPQSLGVVFDALKKFGTTKGDERLQQAVDIIREAISPSSPALGEVPDEFKPFADSLKAKEADLNKRSEDAARQQRESREAAHMQSIDRAEDAAAKSVADQLRQRFASSGLSEFEQTAALQKVGDRIDATFGHKNSDGSWTRGTHPSAHLFQAKYDSILQQHEPGPAREKALKQHILTYTNEVIGPIQAEVLREATKGTRTRQAETNARVNQQRDTSRSEPRGVSTSPNTPGKPMTDSELRAAIKKEYMDSHGGEEPDVNYMITEGFKRKGIASVGR